MFAHVKCSQKGLFLFPWTLALSGMSGMGGARGSGLIRAYIRRTRKTALIQPALRSSISVQVPSIPIDPLDQQHAIVGQDRLPGPSSGNVPSPGARRHRSSPQAAR
jgi:hypothetical protein